MKKGADFDDTKWSNYEVTMSFPTETGLPLTFQLKAPMIMSVSGQSKAKTESESDNKSSIPRSATASAKIRFVYGMKLQKRLSFVTPFESQEYIAGIDRDIQVHVPVRSEMEFDKEKKEVRVKFQPNEDAKEFKVLQYKTQPFTSKHDILSLQPVSNDKSTHTINKSKSTSSQLEMSDKSNQQKLQFKWERQNEQESKKNENREDKRRNEMEAATSLAQSIASLYIPTASPKQEYEKYSIKVTPSSDTSAEMKVSYDSSTSESNNNSDDSESSSPNAKATHVEKNSNERERKQKLLREASKNINSAKADAVDFSLQLNGPTQSSLTVTAAIGRSNVDKKSRALFIASVKNQDGQDRHLSAAIESKAPNVESLDFEETLKANTRREIDAEIHFGKGNDENNESDTSKIKIQGKLKQTEERKNEVRESRDAQECKKQENRNDNKLTSACRKANERAASVNAGELSITVESDSNWKEMLMSAIDSVEGLSQNHAEVQKDRKEKEEKNKIKIEFETSRNDEKVDVTVKTPEGKVEFHNIKLGRKSAENNVNEQEKKDKRHNESRMSPNSEYMKY